MSEEQTAGILDAGLQHLAGEEHDAGLDDGEKQREEWQGDEREFDRGRTAFVAAEPAEESFRWR